uniref:F-box domain-containing protein n=1 Tax=Chromera velia CCMP2878 TaxID=1169474 RepID=A0A0G4FY01_9ALVE|eukprot:Cvel_19204.t1-p1 / transcript=Cvel_19204.t1 / gene=Cvel_19204 / organism=Chromera_velia_CCMP2878 / gene_product=hypothetical protein / transcript_product=hypothetical protein / location=Cvel_scaffold1638:39907-41055(+) / protein_length=225 / sequence_SO=supercontig / SO=protein_coding / is_pseudo=false
MSELEAEAASEPTVGDLISSLDVSVWVTVFKFLHVKELSQLAQARQDFAGLLRKTLIWENLLPAALQRSLESLDVPWDLLRHCVHLHEGIIMCPDCDTFQVSRLAALSGPRLARACLKAAIPHLEPKAKRQKRTKDAPSASSASRVLGGTGDGDGGKVESTGAPGTASAEENQKGESLWKETQRKDLASKGKPLLVQPRLQDVLSPEGERGDKAFSQSCVIQVSC